MVAPVAAAAPAPFVPALTVGDALPAVALYDQRGRRFTIGRGNGGATVVTFFYTRCPVATECPLESAKFAAMARRLRGDPAHLVEITLDPRDDSPAVLARYGARFAADAARWSLATGRPADIEMLERRLGVEVRAGPGATIAHDDELVILDARGRLATRIAGDDWIPAEAVAATLAVEGRARDPLAALTLALRTGFNAACGSAVARPGFSLAAAMLVFAAAVTASTLIALREAGRYSEGHRRGDRPVS